MTAGALMLYSAVRMAADVCQSTVVAWVPAAETGSPGVVALLWALRYLPWFGLPLSGALADRRPRRAVVRAADGAAAVLALAAGILAARFGFGIGLAAVWAGAYGALSAAARPSTKGLARQTLAAPSDAARLSGALTALEYLVLGAGQLAAGLLVRRGPAAAGLLACAALLAVGVGALSLRAPSGAPRAAAADTPPVPVVRLLASPAFRGPFVLTVLCGACAFTARALAPLLVLRHMRAGVLGFAALEAVYALGAGAGSAWLRRGAHWRGGVRTAALAWLLAAPALALAGTARALPPAILAFAALGAAAGVQDAGNASRVAALVPPDAQGRAMAYGSLVWRLPGVLAAGLASLGGVWPFGRLCGVLAAVQAAVAAASFLPPVRRAVFGE